MGDKGEGGVKNLKKMGYFIYGRPLKIQRNPAVKVIIILHLLFLVIIFTVFWTGCGLMQDPQTLNILYRKNFLSDSDIINSYN